ncbi:ATP synthase subunit f, mitochondrial-like [Symphalangus syndactylus]|uniref:ATP synthase subunit f, mitochondrial-like n=1 Tax=Symphalangus syndactylus TaxID=9590 RepID=UPI002441AFE5|nr:ATP synthase subunit f, mitochondrial-like [Symphalangus syndactylus]
MVSVTPAKDKKRLEVKLGKLPSWILMQDLVIAAGIQRGYYWCYNKYINMKKGSISGLIMVLAGYMLFHYCLSYKELKHEQLRRYH